MTYSYNIYIYPSILSIYVLRRDEEEEVLCNVWNNETEPKSSKSRMGIILSGSLDTATHWLLS